MTFYTNNIEELINTFKSMIPELSNNEASLLEWLTFIAGISSPILFFLFKRYVQQNDDAKSKALDGKIEHLKSELSLENNKIITAIENESSNKRSEAEITSNFRIKSYDVTLNILMKLNETIQDLIWMPRQIKDVGNKEFEDNIYKKLRDYQIQIHNAYFYLDGELIDCALSIWGSTLSLMNGRVHSQEWEKDYRDNQKRVDELSFKYGELIKNKYYFDNAESNMKKIGKIMENVSK